MRLVNILHLKSLGLNWASSDNTGVLTRPKESRPTMYFCDGFWHWINGSTPDYLCTFPEYRPVLLKLPLTSTDQSTVTDLKHENSGN